MFAHDVWRVWARRWVAEEMRHAIVIRDYITVTHSVDLAALEAGRMQQVCGGDGTRPGLAGRHARVRRAAGARDAHLAPQHRHAARRRSRLQGDGTRRRRREPALPLLPRPRVGRARDRSVGHDARDRTPGAHVRDARHRHPRLHRARRRDRRHRHLRPRAPPRPGARTGRAAPLERRVDRGSRRRSRAGPRRACVEYIARVDRVGKRVAERREQKRWRTAPREPAWQIAHGADCRSVAACSGDAFRGSRRDRSRRHVVVRPRGDAPGDGGRVARARTARRTGARRDRPAGRPRPGIRSPASASRRRR